MSTTGHLIQMTHNAATNKTQRTSPSRSPNQAVNVTITAGVGDLSAAKSAWLFRIVNQSAWRSDRMLEIARFRKSIKSGAFCSSRLLGSRGSSPPGLYLSTGARAPGCGLAGIRVVELVLNRIRLWRG